MCRWSHRLHVAEGTHTYNMHIYIQHRGSDVAPHTHTACCNRACSSCNRAATELQNSFSDGSPTRKVHNLWRTVHRVFEQAEDELPAHLQYMLRQSGRRIQNTTNSSSNNTANATSNTNTDAVVVAKLEIVCSGINCPVELSNAVGILIAVVVGVVVSAT